MREDLDWFGFVVFLISSVVISVSVFITTIEVSEIRKNIETNQECIVHNNEKYCKEAN